MRDKIFLLVISPDFRTVFIIQIFCGLVAGGQSRPPPSVIFEFVSVFGVNKIKGSFILILNGRDRKKVEESGIPFPRAPLLGVEAMQGRERSDGN